MTLQEFLESYIKKNNLTIREFARNCNVNHQTIFNILNKPDYKPDVIILDKISTYTGLSLASMLKMVYPDAFKDEDTLTPMDELLVQAFEKSPENVQDLVLRLVGLK